MLTIEERQGIINEVRQLVLEDLNLACAGAETHLHANENGHDPNRIGEAAIARLRAEIVEQRGKDVACSTEEADPTERGHLY